jgi:ATP-dependent Clp endopeptidase proteolytic subunit ClpP
MAHKWYAFKNSSDKSGEVELSIYSDIGGFGVGADKFAAELREYKGQHIHLRINSLGGEVTEGNAIYNALSRHVGGVTVHIDGIAASMASVIAMAGDEVRMADNAILMIHNPWTMAAGESSDLRKQADVLDLLKEGIVGAYQKKTGLEASAISAMMDEEKWLKAEEAKELGFVDYIEEGFEAAASIGEWRSRFDTWAKAMSHKAHSNEVAPEAAPVAEVADEKPQVEATAPAEPAAPEVASESVAAPEEAAPEVEANPEEEASTPQAKADAEVAAHLCKLSEELKAANERAKLAEDSAAALRAELSKVQTEFSAKSALYDALKRSLGVAEAKEVPAATSEVTSDPVAQWMAAVEAKDFATSNKLYAEHKKAIWAARASLSKATS